MLKFAWGCSADPDEVQAYVPCHNSFNIGSHCVQCAYSTESEKLTAISNGEEDYVIQPNTERGVQFGDGGSERHLDSR